MQNPLAPPTYEVHADQIWEAVEAERRRLGISAQVDADRVLMLSTVHPISRYSRTASASPYDPEIRQALQLAHDEAYQAGLLKNTALPSPCTVFFWHVYSRSNHQSCISTRTTTITLPRPSSTSSAKCSVCRISERSSPCFIPLRWTMSSLR